MNSDLTMFSVTEMEKTHKKGQMYGISDYLNNRLQGLIDIFSSEAAKIMHETSYYKISAEQIAKLD